MWQSGGKHYRQREEPVRRSEGTHPEESIPAVSPAHLSFGSKGGGKTVRGQSSRIKNLSSHNQCRMA